MVASLLPLRQRTKLDTRHRILMAGLDAYTTRGFEDCTIDEIARAAGVGKGTVCHCFRTNEHLVVSFMVDMERQMRPEAATLAQERGGLSRSMLCCCPVKGGNVDRRLYAGVLQGFDSPP